MLTYISANLCVHLQTRYEALIGKHIYQYALQRAGGKKIWSDVGSKFSNSKDDQRGSRRLETSSRN